jgi:hypothetical protein
MKRAYLFGAAALLILLIVVAYVSFSREKKGDVEDGGVCVRPPPQVVGPTADPVVQTLDFDDEDDDVIPLNREDAVFGRADPTEMRIPTLTYVNRPQKYQGQRLVVRPELPMAQFRTKEFVTPDIGPQPPATPIFGGPQPPATPIFGGPQPAIDLSSPALSTLSPEFRQQFMEWAATSCAATPYKSPETIDLSEGEDEGPNLSVANYFTKGDHLLGNDVALEEETRRYKRKRAEESVKAWEELHSDHVEIQKGYVLTLPVTSPLRKKFFQEERAAERDGRYQRLLDLYTGNYQSTPTRNDLFDEFMHS